jgi:RHS repeat-associated protein
LGTVQATYQYDAYGQTTSSTGSVSNPFRYTGQYQDSESGLYYLRARYYDPATQQFLSRDPLAVSRPSEFVRKTPIWFVP